MTDVPNGSIRRDLDRHDREIAALWKDKASTADFARLERSVDGDVAELKTTAKEFRESVTAEIGSLRRAVIGAAITVATGCIGVMITVVLTSGN